MKITHNGFGKLLLTALIISSFLTLKAQETKLSFYASESLVASQKATYKVTAQLTDEASAEVVAVDASQAFIDFSKHKDLLDQGYLPQIMVAITGMQAQSGRFSVSVADIALEGGSGNFMKTNVSNEADGKMEAIVTLDSSAPFLSGWLKIGITDSQSGGKGSLFTQGWKFYARFDSKEGEKVPVPAQEVSPCEEYAAARGVQALKMAIEKSAGLDCEQGYKDRLCEMGQKELTYLMSIEASEVAYDEVLEVFGECPEVKKEAEQAKAQAAMQVDKAMDRVKAKVDVWYERELRLANGDSSVLETTLEEDWKERLANPQSKKEAVMEKPIEELPIENIVEALEQIDTVATNSTPSVTEVNSNEEENEQSSLDTAKQEVTAVVDTLSQLTEEVDNIATNDSVPASEESFDEQLLKDETEWQLAIADNTLEAYQRYLELYPQGRHAAEAKEKVAELDQQKKIMALALDEAAWQLAAEENTLKAYRDYLEEYPEGRHSEEAQKLVEELEEKAQESAIIKLAQDEAAWQLANEANHLSEYEDYLKQYPDGRHAVEAQQKIDSLQEIVIEREILEKAKDEVNWRLAVKTNTLQAFEDYLEKYPEGIHAEEAKQKVEALKEKPETDEERVMRLAKDELSWAKAKKADTLEAYQNYLKEYPKGLHAKEAQEKIKALE